MNRYEEGIKLVEAICGKGKDNVISLATLVYEDEKVYPCVRDVDAHYEDGVFYITTFAGTNKMKQIEQCNEVGFAVCFEGFSGHGIATNRGWVLDEKNKELRAKLRTTFEDWYDLANDEQNENCIILAIRITKGVIMRDHGAVHFDLDFIHQSEGKE